MASVHERKDRKETWFVKYLSGGKWERKTFIGPTAELDAIAFKVKLDGDVYFEERQKAKDPDSPTNLAGLWQHWLITKSAKRSLGKDKQYYEVHIEPYFGRDRRLNTFGKAVLNQFQTDQKAKGYAPRTVNHHVNLLKAMLAEAADNRWINPVASPKKVPTKPTKREIFKTGQEVSDFLDATGQLEERGDNGLNDCYRAIYATAIYAGLRPSEIRQLEWQDIDLARRVIRIQEDERFTPKTPSAIREVDMIKQLVGELTSWSKRQDARSSLCLTCNDQAPKTVGEPIYVPSTTQTYTGKRTSPIKGKPDAGAPKLRSYKQKNKTNYCKACCPLVFPTGVGNKRAESDRAFTSVFKRCRELVPALRDRKDLTMYSCRHTYGSRMNRAGVGDLRLQLLMGHADISTTKLYADHEGESQADQLDRLNVFGNVQELERWLTKGSKPMAYRKIDRDQWVATWRWKGEKHTKTFSGPNAEAEAKEWEQSFRSSVKRVKDSLDDP